MYILKALAKLGPALVLLVLAVRVRKTISRLREAGVTALAKAWQSSSCGAAAFS